jgi:hypothetical protein
MAVLLSLRYSLRSPNVFSGLDVASLPCVKLVCNLALAVELCTTQVFAQWQQRHRI